MLLLKTVVVTLSWLFEGAFQFFSLLTLALSLYMIVIWTIIIFNSNLVIHGDSQDNSQHALEVLSFLAHYYELYALFASINAVIVCFRIFTFFDFSPKLSVFTEILRSSKNDILYMMLMFTMMMMGYAITGNLLFGTYSDNWEDVIKSLAELLKAMIFEFEYDEMESANSDMSGFHLVSFMVIVVLFLQNMLISIIIAHYNEFVRNQKHFTDSKNSNSFFTLCVKLLFKAIPKSYKYNTNSVKRKFYLRMESMYNAILKMEDDELKGMSHYDKRQIEVLRRRLSAKYEKPEYTRQHMHYAVKPYMQAGGPVPNIDSTNPLDVLKTMEVGLYPKNIKEIDQPYLTQINTWIMALEQQLMSVTASNPMVFSEFMCMQDRFHDIEYKPIANPSFFTSVQTQFLLQPDTERTEYWRK